MAIQIVKAFFVDDRSDFSGDAARLHVFVQHDDFVCLLHVLTIVHIERSNGAQSMISSSMPSCENLGGFLAHEDIAA